MARTPLLIAFALFAPGCTGGSSPGERLSGGEHDRAPVRSPMRTPLQTIDRQAVPEAPRLSVAAPTGAQSARVHRDAAGGVTIEHRADVQWDPSRRYGTAKGGGAAWWSGAPGAPSGLSRGSDSTAISRGTASSDTRSTAMCAPGSGRS